MPTSIQCDSRSTLSSDQVTLLSSVFPHHSRFQLIEMRRLMNDPAANFRTYSEGTVTFDREGLIKATAFRVSLKASERLASLLDQGVCPQALATEDLRIPLTAGTMIAIKAPR